MPPEHCLCEYAIKQTAGQPIVHDKRCQTPHHQHEPGGSGAGSTVWKSSRVYRSRTKDELKTALQLFINRKAVLHVPVDEENDADCILADGIYELDQIRTDLQQAQARIAVLQRVAEAAKTYRQAADAVHGINVPWDAYEALRNALDAAEAAEQGG